MSLIHLLSKAQRNCIVRRTCSVLCEYIATEMTPVKHGFVIYLSSCMHTQTKQYLYFLTAFG